MSERSRLVPRLKSFLRLDMATGNQLAAMTAAIVAVAKAHHLTMLATAAEIQALASEAAKAASDAYEANQPEVPKP